MKKVLFAAVILFSSAFAIAQDDQLATPVQNVSKAKLEFVGETSKDFGDINQGDKVEHTFTFKNTGTEPLILSNVQTTCGCTATDWPRNPIPPGATGEIKAVFNSAGKMGKQNKTITVISNSNTGSDRVNIISNVLPPKPATNSTTEQK